MQHSPRFLAHVAHAREGVTEIPAADLAHQLAGSPGARLIDVREDREFAAGHVAGAEHLGRGVLERDIETRVPDLDTPLYLYCGGGYRSILAARALQQMGYRRVFSVAGGWAALQALPAQDPIRP